MISYDLFKKIRIGLGIFVITLIVTLVVFLFISGKNYYSIGFIIEYCVGGFLMAVITALLSFRKKRILLPLLLTLGFILCAGASFYTILRSSYELSNALNIITSIVLVGLASLVTAFALFSNNFKGHTLYLGDLFKLIRDTAILMFGPLFFAFSRSEWVSLIVGAGVTFLTFVIIGIKPIKKVTPYITAALSLGTGIYGIIAGKAYISERYSESYIDFQSEIAAFNTLLTVKIVFMFVIAVGILGSVLAEKFVVGEHQEY